MLDRNPGGEGVAHAGQDPVGSLPGRLAHLVADRVDIVGVVAEAARHQVVAGAPVQNIASGFAPDIVGESRAVERVVAGRTLDQLAAAGAHDQSAVIKAQILNACQRVGPVRAAHRGRAAGRRHG